ncbi:hypothetical protein F53441_536 [Fusarium austroafricanum]|uniref:LIM zinc-binding domain-containing protein n=1 Tax=Fusarium austroafricanum TaxID=2364996 RepID=A0A8H4P631_9HYPO|nr:hypothetical protein F53441_536 [Fusarium austroafricanum]
MTSPGQTNIFTCTFCFHVSQGPPQIIGRSARLACPTCHAALLNLAICWVCGELIFRGDECVSFGWCFWHRACYGCLLYGSRAIYQGVPVQDLFTDRGVDDGTREGCGGREVSEVPLCAACVVEVEVDEVKEESIVVNRGLRRVEKVDAGLTRKRWEAKNSDKNSKSSAPQPRIHEVGGGIASDEIIANNVSLNPRDTSKSVIWVDIFDPINGPSFKPSPLKPIPLFMQRPPSPTVHEPERRSTVNDTYLQPPYVLRKPHSAPCSVCPPEAPADIRPSDHYIARQPSPSSSKTPPPPPRSPAPSRTRETQQSLTLQQDYIKDDHSSEVRHRQAVSWVKEEPLKRPSSRLAPSRRSDLNRSDANSPAYRTPPEYPDQPLALAAHVALATNCACHTTIIRVSGPLPACDNETGAEPGGKKIEKGGCECERGRSWEDEVRAI